MPDTNPDRLRLYNVVMAFLHAASALGVLILANGFSLPVTATYLQGPPGSAPGESLTLFDVDVAWAVAIFLLLSAFFHVVVASPWFYQRYRDGLEGGRNNFRWVEYSLSASLMIVLIAMITGILDISALIPLFGVNAAMIFFGAVQEKYEKPGGSLLPFWLGSIAGVVPWLAIGIYLFSPGGDAAPPGFVYGIFFSLFLFFNCFALNQYLQYRQIGKWKDYLFGERVYILLSLVAKTALAWQVFGGTLAG